MEEKVDKLFSEYEKALQHEKKDTDDCGSITKKKPFFQVGPSVLNKGEEELSMLVKVEYLMLYV